MILHRPAALLVFYLSAILVVPVAFAQEWTVTTSDFKTARVQLHSFGPDGFHLVDLDSKAQISVPLDQFVSIQHPAGDEPSSPANFALVLRNGDRLTGEPGSVANEKLTWVSPQLGKVPVPFSKLVVINRGTNFSVPDESPKQDMVTLANGDTVAGVFTDCADSKVTMQVDAGPTSIPLESIKRIIFAATGGAGSSDSSRAFRIHLNDSSIITAADASSDGTRLKLTLQGKNAPSLEVPISSVVEIEQMNGPVGWLSSMTPTENVQLPYLTGSASWPARFDASVDGSPLSFEGQTFDHGIGVHAYSRLTFAIDPRWKYFRTQYAIDSQRDQPRKYADVTVRIKLDGKVVHEQKHFREGVLSPVILQDLGDAKTLTLECDYGDSGDTQAHLDWLAPAFLHDQPPADTAPPASTQP